LGIGGKDEWEDKMAVYSNSKKKGGNRCQGKRKSGRVLSTRKKSLFSVLGGRKPPRFRKKR